MLFGGRVSAEHREDVTDWWAELMGGPSVFSESRGVPALRRRGTRWGWGVAPPYTPSES